MAASRRAGSASRFVWGVLVCPPDRPAAFYFLRLVTSLSLSLPARIWPEHWLVRWWFVARLPVVRFLWHGCHPWWKRACPAAAPSISLSRLGMGTLLPRQPGRGSASTLSAACMIMWI